MVGAGYVLNARHKEISTRLEASKLLLKGSDVYSALSKSRGPCRNYSILTLYTKAKTKYING